MKAKHLFLLCLLFIGTWLIYWPGVNGGFIFDDHYNLETLSELNDEVNAKNVKIWLGKSHSGPLKRPVSMVSFLMNGQSWPTDPKPFKVTNIVIHLLNGLLLFILVFKILSIKRHRFEVAFTLAWLVSALWLLHPLLVSTTLYVIQRMAMLPGTFILFGLIHYLLIRRKQQSKNNLNFIDFLNLSVAYLLATTLAVLSKENGIMLLVIIPVFECLICRNFLKFKKLPSLFSAVFVIMPVGILLIAITIQIPDFIDKYDVRNFTMYERCLTQVRVLILYLRGIFLPDYFGPGVFGNWMVVSKGWLQPISTLWSALGIAFLIVLSFILRVKNPVISFSVLFYFLSQFLESTFIPLDMYYEHRAYVSSMFIGFPLVYLAYKKTDKLEVVVIGGLSVTLLLAFLTSLRVSIWSNNLLLHELTAEKYPNSSRARTMLAYEYSRRGREEEALKVIEQAEKELGNLSFTFNKQSLKCNMKTYLKSDIHDLANEVKIRSFEKSDIQPFFFFLNKLAKNACSGNDKESFESIVEAFLANGSMRTEPFDKIRSKFLGSLALSNGQFLEASMRMTESFDDSDEMFNQSITNLITLISNDINAAENYYCYIDEKANKKYKYSIDWFGVQEALLLLGEELKKRKNILLSRNESLCI